MTAGGKSHAQRILEALPPPGEPMAIEALCERSGLSKRQISDAVAALARHGLAQRSGIGEYILTDEGCELRAAGKQVTSGPNSKTGPRNAQKNSLRARLWAAIRAQKKGTVRDFLNIASNGHDAVSEAAAIDNARRYLKALAQAEIIVTLKQRAAGTAPESNGHMIYILVKDLGPVAPIYNPRDKTLRHRTKILWSASDEH